MKLALVRVKEDESRPGMGHVTVGVFYFADDDDLFDMIDEQLNPFACEYHLLKKSFNIFIDRSIDDEVVDDQAFEDFDESECPDRVKVDLWYGESALQLYGDGLAKLHRSKHWHPVTSDRYVTKPALEEAQK